MSNEAYFWLGLTTGLTILVIRHLGGWRGIVRRIRSARKGTAL